MKKNRPFVFSNFAMSADGKIAFGNHQFVPFGSTRDREHMMELRATADAVICGARTVESTGTILGNGAEKFRKQRLRNGLAEFPLRILVSGSGSINPQANIFSHRFSPIIILTTEQISKSEMKVLQTTAAEIKIFGEHEIDFNAALCWLRKKWKVKRLLCEGGGELHGALVRANLINEMHLTICPKIFGGKNAPTIAEGIDSPSLAMAARFKTKSMLQVKDELFVVLTNKKPSSYSQPNSARKTPKWQPTPAMHKSRIKNQL